MMFFTFFLDGFSDLIAFAISGGEINDEVFKG
jgi:hypothetical protein